MVPPLCEIEWHFHDRKRLDMYELQERLDVVIEVRDQQNVSVRSIIVLQTRTEPWCTASFKTLGDL